MDINACVCLGTSARFSVWFEFWAIFSVAFSLSLCIYIMINRICCALCDYIIVMSRFTEPYRYKITDGIKATYT